MQSQNTISSGLRRLLVRITTLTESKSANKLGLYRLGCVLLEIGFWQSLQTFDRSTPYAPLDFQKRLLHLTTELEGRAGSTYAGAVRECLSIAPLEQDPSARDTSQDILCWKVAAALDQCMA